MNLLFGESAAAGASVTFWASKNGLTSSQSTTSSVPLPPLDVVFAWCDLACAIEHTQWHQTTIASRTEDAGNPRKAARGVIFILAKCRRAATERERDRNPGETREGNPRARTEGRFASALVKIVPPPLSCHFCTLACPLLSFEIPPSSFLPLLQIRSRRSHPPCRNAVIVCRTANAPSDGTTTATETSGGGAAGTRSMRREHLVRS